MPCSPSHPRRDRAWVDMRLHESHNEGASASPTTLSQGTPRRTRQTLGLSPSWALSLALPRKFGCQATTSRIPPPGASPPFVRSSTCTQHFCRTTTARSSLQRTCPHCRQARAAAPRPTQEHHHHRRQRAPRIPALAPSSFRNLTASTRHTSGDRLLPRRRRRTGRGRIKTVKRAARRGEVGNPCVSEKV